MGQNAQVAFRAAAGGRSVEMCQLSHSRGMFHLGWHRSFSDLAQGFSGKCRSADGHDVGSVGPPQMLGDHTLLSSRPAGFYKRAHQPGSSGSRIPTDLGPRGPGRPCVTPQLTPRGNRLRARTPVARLAVSALFPWAESYDVSRDWNQG